SLLTSQNRCVEIRAYPAYASNSVPLDLLLCRESWQRVAEGNLFFLKVILLLQVISNVRNLHQVISIRKYFI
uniref:hypothetical protein n=1 Tax=Herbaspirillum aquaticum TaxID=568783 RepID=UPI0024DE8DDD